MKYTYFKIENFKGIRSEKIDFTRNPNSKIFKFVNKIKFICYAI